MEQESGETLGSKNRNRSYNWDFLFKYKSRREIQSILNLGPYKPRIKKYSRAKNKLVVGKTKNNHLQKKK